MIAPLNKSPLNKYDYNVLYKIQAHLQRGQNIHELGKNHRMETNTGKIPWTFIELFTL
jgi:hypothetical protein